MSTVTEPYFVDSTTVYKRGHGPVRFWSVYETGAGDDPDLAVADFRRPVDAHRYADRLNRYTLNRKRAHEEADAP